MMPKFRRLRRRPRLSEIRLAAIGLVGYLPDLEHRRAAMAKHCRRVFVPFASFFMVVQHTVRMALIFCLAAAAAATGCRSLRPSNDRNWSSDQAVLPRAEVQGSTVTVRNVRNCSYHSMEDYEVVHEDRSYNLDKLNSVDFVVVPFSGMPTLAHTFLTFGFEDGEHLAISIEVRKEKGEGYSALKGLFNQYEIMYVVGDERDLIGLRSNYRLDDVYIYRGKATPKEARAVLLDMLARTNKLADEPEFYNLITNNCTTNVARHVNNIAPDVVPWNYRLLLPGYSDRLAYDLGLIEGEATFEATQRAARANRLAYIFRDSPEFSTKIRR